MERGFDLSSHRAIIAGAALAVGFLLPSGKTSNESVPPNSNPRVTHVRDRHILSDQYSHGVRVVTFRPAGRTALAQVTEFCHGSDGIEETTRVHEDEKEGEYTSRYHLRVLGDTPACADGEITRADGLPLPKPPRSHPMPHHAPQPTPKAAHLSILRA